MGEPAPIPPGSVRIGALPGSTPIHVVVVLKPHNAAGLAQVAAAVSRPGPLYHHYLRPGSFASTFGPSASTVGTVEGVLRAEGLHVTGTSESRLAISVEGSAAAVSSAFTVRLNRYRIPGGRTAYGNGTAPLVPTAIAPDVQTVLGLANTVTEHPAGLARPAPAVGSPTAAVGTARQPLALGPNPCAGATGVGRGSYTANRLATAYGFNSLYAAGDLGAGVTVALYELEPNLTTDISTFQACYGTSPPPSSTPRSTGVSARAGDQGEAALDIEDVLSLAPGVTIDTYQAPNTGLGAYDDFSAMVNASTPPQVISSSWGLCESQEGLSSAQAEEVLFEQAAAQGQTVLVAQGDDGSAGCTRNGSGGLAVDDPGSDPYVTGVGGTHLTLNGSDRRATEPVWNDSSISNGAGGGGVSKFWTMPSYQSGAAGSLNVVNADSSSSMCGAPPGTYCRESPDVSADSDPQTGYAIYWNGTWIAIGGTSAAAPLWAALVALADASTPCAPAGPLGWLNPDLYSLAGSSAGGYASAFYDVPPRGQQRLHTSDLRGGPVPDGDGLRHGDGARDA